MLEAALRPFIDERIEFAEAERAFNPKYNLNPYIVVSILGGPPCPPFSRVQGPKAVAAGEVADTLLGKSLRWIQRLRQLLPPRYTVWPIIETVVPASNAVSAEIKRISDGVILDDLSNPTWEMIPGRLKAFVLDPHFRKTPDPEPHIGLTSCSTPGPDYS